MFLQNGGLPEIGSAYIEGEGHHGGKLVVAGGGVSGGVFDSGLSTRQIVLKSLLSFFRGEAHPRHDAFDVTVANSPYPGYILVGIKLATLTLLDERKTSVVYLACHSQVTFLPKATILTWPLVTAKKNISLHSARSTRCV